MIALLTFIVVYLMSPAQEKISPETAELIASLAEAEGLSVDAYLRRMLHDAAQAHGMEMDAYIKGILAARAGTRRAEPVNLNELDRLLEKLSEGTEHIAPLSPDFSRADIYGDHP